MRYSVTMAAVFLLGALNPPEVVGQVELATNRNDVRASVSPDGRWIAFVSRDSHPQKDGSGLLQLTAYPEREIAPKWSGDGGTLAFHRNTRMESTDRTWNWDVYVIGVEGGDATRITFDPGEDLFPTWFPKGARLMLESERELGLLRLYGVDVSSSDGSFTFEPVGWVRP